jgi:hypothetical protein
MTTTFRVDTYDGKSYVGEIRGGFIDIDGVRITAQNVIAGEIPANLYGTDHDLKGYFDLVDGSRLSVRGGRSAGVFFRDRIWGNWSGEIVLYVESIGKEIVIR